MAGCWLELPRAGSALSMSENLKSSSRYASSESLTSSTTNRTRLRRRLVFVLALVGGLSLVAAAGAVSLGSKASEINSELTSATHLIPMIKEQIASDDSDSAEATVQELRSHTAAAKKAADDPLWTLASALPVLGSNFAAVTEVARSADDVARLAITPLVQVYSSLNWERIVPTGSGADLGPIQAAAPGISAAAHAVRLSADRLQQIDTTTLMPEVADPLGIARDQLEDLTGTLDAAASASSIGPGMLGAQTPRNYLLIIQNNAEARASGGIPGALAVLSLDKGRLTLGSQSSAGALGTMSPVVPVDPQQQQIYSQRVGKYMQDVNLTPDFPTAAMTAQAMWERKTGQRVDGVISIDPVALGYVLDATGPVQIRDAELLALASQGLPTELTGKNIVPTLLSEVYAQIEQPALQDAYFAGVAKEVFAALSSGTGNAKGLIAGLTRATDEGRVLVWSGLQTEQSILEKYSLSGSVAGPSVAPAQFGVYFNDGTGAKMDYYVKRTVQLVKDCPADGYEQIRVRVTNTNTAPRDASTSLPAYVTGGGVFGTAPGSVQTNIVAYGPIQANVESATVGGQKTPFAPYVHADRPVGVIATHLAPGESKTVELTFSKIVQHTEPALFVTPTVQPVKEVILPAASTSCGDGS